ncbi:chorismate--pyruvate lyase family protein [Shewanella cyperi]|uniref:chorismate--pyruvate lyase family protein n=1 Tax=Shewanella cyperi TaxID=2814292 RepID=UPI001A93EE16|nr:chorismate lyase [Shewanella cyperi]QSX40840.1 chorismate lyase [Shewanella cyperi]
MSVTSLSFPYGESIQWFSPDAVTYLPDGSMTDWILAPGSLTARLKALGLGFEVRVLGEGFIAAGDEQMSAPWVREVLLCLGGIPWVFARTLVPTSLLNQCQAELMGLGDKPLGELLFSDPRFIPGRIEVASFNNCSRLAQLAASLSQTVTGPLWGRRRYFGFGHDELTVCEMFLPAAVTALSDRNQA